MKRLVPLFYLALIQVVYCRSPGDDRSRQYEPEDACVLELNSDRNRLEAAFEEAAIPEDDEEVGKFFLCYWNKMGIMKKDGGVNAERLGQYFTGLLFENNQLNATDRALLKNVINSCKYEQGKTAIQTAIRLRNCAK